MYRSAQRFAEARSQPGGTSTASQGFQEFGGHDLVVSRRDRYLGDSGPWGRRNQPHQERGVRKVTGVFHWGTFRLSPSPCPRRPQMLDKPFGHTSSSATFKG